MVILRIPPLTSWYNLRGNRLLEPFLADLLSDLLSNFLLLRAVRVDRTAVLGTHVWALSVQRCGVVHAVEELEELAVAHKGGVKGDLESFGICNKTVSYVWFTT